MEPAMKRTPVPPGTKVYGLNICQAIRDHAKCPGFTTLRAGRFNLGPVACKCDCHKKPSLSH
jgi:hypothetical protein